MSVLIKKIIHTVIIAIVLIAVVVGNTFAYMYRGVISGALVSSDSSFTNGEEGEAIKAAGDALVQEMQAEGSVLMYNDGTLPLDEDTSSVNLLGWGSSDNGFSLSGTGSGGASASGKQTKLVEAFTDAGWDVNMELQEMYNDYAPERVSYISNKDIMRLAEVPIDEYGGVVQLNAIDYSDTAIMVITRVAGENMGEISPTSQDKYKVAADNTRGTLELSTEEEDLVLWMTENFENTVVLLNTCNTMHIGALTDAGVGAVMYIGQTGQSGTKSIPGLLTGEINPSGRLADTYIYDKTDDPTYVNSVRVLDNIQYVEDIYFGYKWYETADFEGYFDSKIGYNGINGYDGVVQYPFGYGLSYTTFTQEIVANDADYTVNTNDLQFDDTIKVTVKVENTGSVAGKEVVQLYSTPPYTSGEIEKAHVNLVAFAKTAELDPGQSQFITLEVDAYDLASYDCYDKNGNGFMGWELEAGDYELKVMKNSHEVIDSVTYTVGADISYEYDPVTGVKVENRWTGNGAYAGTPIDASTVGGEKVYLSRSDFAATFPAAHAKTPTGYNSAVTFRYNGYDSAKMPTTNQDNGHYLTTYEDGSKVTQGDLDGSDLSGKKLVFNEELITQIGNDYDSEVWQEIVEQMSMDEMKYWVECSGFGTAGVDSVGKPKGEDLDGPSGFNRSVTTVGGGKAERTAFPCANLLACSWNQELLFAQGRSQGAEANASGVTGWYAPTVNLHRSNYNARNFEAYSEDGVLSGMMASELIRGAKTNNLTCYLKHLVLSEPGNNPKWLNTWLTEQNLRENYLRAFEIPVKDGGANAVMSAFNRLGATWTGSNYPLLTEVLRGEWGFNGVVITDWTTGDSEMNPSRGVVAGNDIWLNPNTVSGAPISTSNAAEMAAAQRASKNVMYAFTNTYYSYLTYDASADDKYNTTVGISVSETEFEWWIPLVIGLDLLVLAGLGFYGYKVWSKKSNVEVVEKVEV